MKPTTGTGPAELPQMTPSFTIITVTFNSERYLKQTIFSIAEQTYNNFEYIVIDGGSKDGTLELIKKYESKIDHWISEPDNGVADAMNKGIEMATGDYILFIHSDDYLISPDILERISHYLLSNLDMYIFQVHCIGPKIKHFSQTRTFGWLTNFKMGSCHQGQICSRGLFARIGKFDTSFQINMDYDFHLRAYRSSASSVAIPISISVMRLVGISSRADWPNLRERFAEERRVHLKNCPNMWMCLIYKVYWSLYLPYRKIRFLLA